MLKVELPDAFTDERGWIRDLIVDPDEAVTRIHTVKGAVRGNHFHKLTTQWTYVLSGSLQIADGHNVMIIGPDEMVVHYPTEPHAWKALEDTDCLVFTSGPRAENYESDTYRLDKPILE